MELSSLYLMVLAASLTGLVAQLLVKEKQARHLLFAVFCGSIAFSITKKMSGDALGAYQYLIGMGACATCNCFWLFARSLFRKTNPIAMQHIIVAAAIAALIMFNQGYQFVIHHWQVPEQNLVLVKALISELTILLSSCILVLTFWEACRGFKQANKTEQQQRLVFLSMFAVAVLTSKIVNGHFVEVPQIQEWITNFIILFVIATSQILLLWQKNQQQACANFKVEEVTDPARYESNLEYADSKLAQQIEQLLIKQEHFLQANLKVGDLAKQLNVPEYKVSKVIRHYTDAPNFNHYVNQLRIEHAKKLLTDPDKQQWPVLVVGLESGFASVGPFSRAFKNFTGSTPNQYRTQNTC